MRVIAHNLTTRNVQVDQLFREWKATGWSPEHPSADKLKELVEQCVAGGADGIEINIQQHYDRPEVMTSVINLVQQVTERQLCLSTNHVQSLEAGLQACHHSPLVNYVSIDEDRLRQILPLTAKYAAELILLVTDPAKPGDAQEMLKTAAILVGAANEAGIPNDRLFIDPGLFHINSDIGQHHLVEVMEFLHVLPEAFDPPLRSTCWLSNVSVGVPQRLRSVIETTLLAILAGLKLSSVFMDVLTRENRRTLRLIKILNNEVIYSNRDIEL